MWEPTYFVLASMLGGPVSGSAIIKRVETSAAWQHRVLRRRQDFPGTANQVTAIVQVVEVSIVSEGPVILMPSNCLA
jgi:hypothetical protein